MGLFSKKVSYPELAPDNPAAQQIRTIEGALKELVGQVSDPLEVVPVKGHAFVFIGKPPKKFGMAKVDDKVHSFVASAKERGIGQLQMQKINEKLRTAYQNCQEAKRYQTNVAGKAVIVTPNEQLAQEVSEIMSVVYN